MLFDVFETELRANGYEEWKGRVEAENSSSALSIANHLYPAKMFNALYVIRVEETTNAEDTEQDATHSSFPEG